MAAICDFLGSVIQKMVPGYPLETIIILRKAMGEVRKIYILYGDCFPPLDLVKLNEASGEIRKTSAKLAEAQENVPWYEFFAFFKVVPKRDCIKDIQGSLIGWSNAIYDKEPLARSQYRMEINKMLDTWQSFRGRQ